MSQTVIDEAFVRQEADKVEEEDVKGALDRAQELWEKLASSEVLTGHIADCELLMALLEDWWGERYRQVPLWAIGTAAFGILYVLNPADLIPDVLPIIGHADDSAVLSLCLRLLRPELEAYRAWKEDATLGAEQEAPVVEE